MSQLTALVCSVRLSLRLLTVFCAGDHFPLEARHHLAPWLEQNFTTELDLGNPQHEEHAQRLVLELVAQLESKGRCSKFYF